MTRRAVAKKPSKPKTSPTLTRLLQAKTETKRLRAEMHALKLTLLVEEGWRVAKPVTPEWKKIMRAEYDKSVREATKRLEKRPTESQAAHQMRLHSNPGPPGFEEWSWSPYRKNTTFYIDPVTKDRLQSLAYAFGRCMKRVMDRIVCVC